MSEMATELNQTIVAGILGVVSSVMIGLISFFGGRGSVQAQLQGQLNASMKLHIDRQDEILARNEERLQQMEVKVRGLQQYNESLARILRDNDIPVPPPPVVAPVFILDSLPQTPDPSNG